MASRVQDFMGKSDPYLQFARQNSNGSYTVVHKIPVSQSNTVTYVTYLAHQDCFTQRPFFSLASSLPPSLTWPQFIRNTLNPHWPQFTVESRNLCGNDGSRSIKVQCYDWDEASAPDLIGEFHTTLTEMSQAAEGKKVCVACKMYKCLRCKYYC